MQIPDLKGSHFKIMMIMMMMIKIMMIESSFSLIIYKYLS